jgi:hypothetical protein
MGYGFWRARPRPVEQQYTKPNTTIRIVAGDLFDQQANLVIGMTNTFDTQVPHIIGRESIQGQFLSRIYHDDNVALDADVASELAKEAPIGVVDKPGNQTVFELGTVITIRHHRTHYFCVAYSEMNHHNQAQATVDGLWRSLSNLWAKVRAHANGEPVAIPVLGGGLSRLSRILPAQDAIRLIVLSYMFASRQTAVTRRLDVIVHPSAIDELDLLEIQDFLDSLQES